MIKEKIIKLLEEYEYDIIFFGSEYHQDIRDKYKGEIDNLWNELAEKISCL